MKRPYAPDSGITLLEMMIVIMLMAMLGAISTHGWRHHQHGLLLNEVSEQLLSFLHFAQAEAGWYNVNYRVEAHQKTQDKWHISIEGGTHANTDKPCEVAGRYCFFPPQKGIALVSYSDAIMQFYGRRNGANGGHLLLENAAGRVRIVLSAKGRLRRCSELGALTGIAAC